MGRQARREEQLDKVSSLALK